MWNIDTLGILLTPTKNYIFLNSYSSSTIKGKKVLGLLDHQNKEVGECDKITIIIIYFYLKGFLRKHYISLCYFSD